MKEISYYELLKMIKDGNIPKKVNYKITGYLENYVEYTAQYDRNDFTHYELTNHHREDENIHFYLNENYLESDMFEESILILKEEKEIPLKINKIIPSQNYVISDSKNHSVDERLEIIRKRLYANELYMLDIANTLNEVLDYLKSKGDE